MIVKAASLEWVVSIVMAYLKKSYLKVKCELKRQCIVFALPQFYKVTLEDGRL
jgi:hypothetical protein